MSRQIRTMGLCCAVSAMAFVLASSAVAQVSSKCAPRSKMIDALKNKHGEAARAVGLAGQRSAFELWTSEKSGSWTILLTRTDKVSCIIAAGEEWIEFPSEHATRSQPLSFSVPSDHKAEFPLGNSRRAP